MPSASYIAWAARRGTALGLDLATRRPPRHPIPASAGLCAGSRDAEGLPMVLYYEILRIHAESE